MATNDKGTALNNDGFGSTYGGTQNPDGKAPDGYQKPQQGKASDKDTVSFGGEYRDDSSYGDQEQNPESAAGEKGESAGSDARGSGVSKGTKR